MKKTICALVLSLATVSFAIDRKMPDISDYQTDQDAHIYCNELAEQEDTYLLWGSMSDDNKFLAAYSINNGVKKQNPYAIVLKGKETMFTLLDNGTKSGFAEDGIMDDFYDSLQPENQLKSICDDRPQGYDI